MLLQPVFYIILKGMKTTEYGGRIDTLNVLKAIIKNTSRQVLGFLRGSGREVRRRMIASAVSIIFAVLFCFNLFSFNFDASYSGNRIEEDRKAVDSYDYGEIQDIEKKIKKLEEKGSGSLNVKAQSNVYYLKKFRDSVILGDSITEGLNVYGFLPDDIVFCAIGASLEGSGDLFKKAGKMLPENAFFTFGMNDLIRYRGKAKPFIKEYKKHLKSFAKRSPDTLIYINSITIPSKDAQKSQPSLKHYKEYNKALEKLCDEEGYTFIDNTYILKTNPKLYAPDGIHVNIPYYPLWMNDMILEADL